ncbi:hypothetical protein JG688_00018558, partial [Phytophthora aleatoria]
LRAQIAQQSAELRDIDRRLGRTHRDLDAAKDRNQKLERELDLAGSEIDILRTQISNQEREIDDLQDNPATSDHSLDRVRDALRTSEDALTTARSANADLDTLRSERDTLQTERDEAVHPLLAWRASSVEPPPTQSKPLRQQPMTARRVEDRDAARDETTTLRQYPLSISLFLVFDVALTFVPPSRP